MTFQPCPTCGKPLTSEICSYCADRAVFRIVRRQVVNLVLLALGAAILFLFTRDMAQRNRAMNLSAAQSWYTTGEQQIRAGESEAAIQSFRRASTNDHDNPQYMLVLANALAMSNRDDEARQTLLRLRESRPEDAEINLDLARLAAKQNDLTAAKRYYHNALYGVWPLSSSNVEHQDVQRELIRFLLERNDLNDAMPELLILERDLPESAQAQLEVAQLFVKAGDDRRALDHFLAALKKVPKSSTALEGAGETAFELENYAAAERYLSAAAKLGVTTDRLRATQSILDAFMGNDPLGLGISADLRQRRALDDLQQASERLHACIGPQGTNRDALDRLDTEYQTVAGELNKRISRGNLDVLRSAVNLASRMEAAVPPVCGAPSPLDRALLLLARKHGVTEQ